MTLYSFIYFLVFKHFKSYRPSSLFSYKAVSKIAPKISNTSKFERVCSEYSETFVIYLFIKRLDIVFSLFDGPRPVHCIYSRTSMARTPLEPWNYLRDRGSSN